MHFLFGEVKQQYMKTEMETVRLVLLFNLIIQFSL